MTQPSSVAGKDLIGPLDLTDEEYREYEWFDDLDRKRVYRVNKPSALYYRTGGTTHRVVDSDGITHCIPMPGQLGCALRWKATPNPVQF